MTDPCMDRFCQPLPVVKYECGCGTVFSGDDEGSACSACDADICEKCSDSKHCRNNNCENVYCNKCAEKLLIADGVGYCVPCIFRWHKLEYDAFMAEVTKPFRRTG